MISPARFDRIHGKEAFLRLCSMLDEPMLPYQRIAKKLGLTKQRIGQLAKDISVNGRQRQRERTLCREPRVMMKKYPPDIQAVINKIRRSGIQVGPYNSRQRSRPSLARRSQRLVLVNGSLCSLQVRKGHKLRPRGRDYVRFDVSGETKRAKFALWAIKNGGEIKLYVIPLSHLRNVSCVYIPADGKYAIGSRKKPVKDWTRHEEAWHLLGGVKLRTNSASSRHEVHT